MQNLLRELMPKRIKQHVSEFYRKKFETERKSVSARIPVINLPESHLENCKLLPDRDRLLSFLPKSGVVAELGVDKGDFSKRILDITQPQTLHLIDAWNTERYGIAKQNEVIQKFRTGTEAGTVKLHIGLSTERVHDFPDAYFDWIYIDTDHSYTTTAAELELYLPKMKTNGIIAGHDFINGNWIKGYKYGVMEAVYQFCNKHNWEFIFLTMEMTDHPSFAIRKISD